MKHPIIRDGAKGINERSLEDGGFAGHPGGDYRTDATAWAIMALSVAGTSQARVQNARSRLVQDQLEDGRVCLLAELPQACWPTPLAVMAWHGSPGHEIAKNRAVDFLLGFEGNHYRKKENDPTGHDTAIKGWPWIENTHSWVEPTALALLALEIVGQVDHSRAREARRMLLNRQLPSGGWNYGNTKVFGRELRPMPESTGLALSALADRVHKTVIAKSISYLKATIGQITTPLSLCWTLLGLGAWGAYPRNADDLLVSCLKKQNVLGPYQTFHLSLLMISLEAQNGLRGLIQNT